VQLWDCRQAGAAVLAMGWDAVKDDAAAVSACSGVQCVAVCRARPHICAAGSEDGSITWWDVRMPVRICPVAEITQEVAFHKSQ
jgi:hypothetical protein